MTVKATVCISIFKKECVPAQSLTESPFPLLPLVHSVIPCQNKVYLTFLLIAIRKYLTSICPEKNITTFCVVSMILVASKLPRRGRQVGPIPSRSVQTAPICAEGRHQRCQVSSFGSFIVLPSAQAEMTSLSSGPESPLKIWLRLTCRGQGYNLTSLTLA